MKLPILRFTLSALLLGAGISAQAQITYTSRPEGGKWSDASTWIVTGNGPQVPTNSPSRNGSDASDNVIVINSAVVLDQDYTVCGDHGKLTITATGSLTDGDSPNAMTFGQQQGADMVRLDLDGRMDINAIRFYKADADISATAELSSSCNISLENQSDMVIAPGAEVQIDGNLMVRQGNPSITGSGTLAISGCVLTNNNGSLNGLFGPSLRVCVQGQANDCATEGMSCNPRALEAITVNACAVKPLPVELASFTVRYYEQRVQVRWVTAMEQNSQAFTVERSANGRDFEAIQTVRAAGNSASSRSYGADDLNPLPGLSYYRLKQTDLDGTFTYSAVRTVQTGRGSKQQFEAYGTSAALTVEMNADAQFKAIRVMDSMGRLIHSETMPEDATGLVTRQIQLNRGSSGVYIVQAVTSDGIVSKKLFLQ